MEHRKPLPFGNAEYEYEWQGDDMALVGWKYGKPRRGVITVGPFRLRVIENRMDYGAYVVMRDGWKARLYAAWYKATRWWRWLEMRLILTLYVWSLAQHNQYAMVSWDDVYVVAKVKRWLGNIVWWDDDGD